MASWASKDRRKSKIKRTMNELIEISLDTRKRSCIKQLTNTPYVLLSSETYSWLRFFELRKNSHFFFYFEQTTSKCVHCINTNILKQIICLQNDYVSLFKFVSLLHRRPPPVFENVYRKSANHFVQQRDYIVPLNVTGVCYVSNRTCC